MTPAICWAVKKHCFFADFRYFALMLQQRLPKHFLNKWELENRRKYILTPPKHRKKTNSIETHKSQLEKTAELVYLIFTGANCALLEVQNCAWFKVLFFIRKFYLRTLANKFSLRAKFDFPSKVLLNANCALSHF